MAEAIVFDLDDTLYLERDYVLSGYAAVARWLSLNLGLDGSTVFAELASLFSENPRQMVIDRWLNIRGMPRGEVLDAILEVYREHQPTLQLLDGWGAALDALRRRYKLGLLTDGRISGQQRKIDALGLRPLFDQILISDELGVHNRKPSARPYLTLACRLGVPNENCIYVADNPSKDFLGARRAGWSSIRVRLPGGLNTGVEPLTADARPDAEISNVSLVDLELAIDRVRGRHPARPRLGGSGQIGD